MKSRGDAVDAPVLAISCLGRLGRFGNQLFQYSFIRIVADANGYRVLCPPWLGARVFGLSDGEPFAEPREESVVVQDLILDLREQILHHLREGIAAGRGRRERA